jgi:soluble lytic murein transglycosylase-like protein
MEKLTTTRFNEDLARCLVTAVFIVLLFKSSFYDESREPLNVIDEPPVSKIEIPVPLPDKRPVVIPEKKSPPACREKKELQFSSIIQQAAKHHCVDPNLVKAIIMAESGYNPKAVSKKGARGLMQLMPKTAEALGVKDSFNPEHNIHAGVGYFKQLLNQFDGDVELALAAYNAGSRKVRKYKGVPPFKATQYYVKKVFKYYHYYKGQRKGDIERT